MIRFLSLIAIIMTFAASASAQEAAADSRASTGGAQTLADILERQQGRRRSAGGGCCRPRSQSVKKTRPWPCKLWHQKLAVRLGNAPS